MKPSTEHLIGTIEGYDEKRGGLRIFVPYDDISSLIIRKYSKCVVQLTDERPITHAQRRAIYALLGALSDYIGLSKDDTKEYFKLKFLSDNLNEMGETIFSLADAPVSLCREFQDYLVQVIVREGVPCSFDILQFIDEGSISSYIYACLCHKRCAVCGRSPCDLHHWDHVGTGRSRDTIDHIGMRVEPLCRECHTEVHMIGQKTFDEKYHIQPVELDKSIAALYGIKTKRS